jgi:hypothetical protein
MPISRRVLRARETTARGVCMYACMHASNRFPENLFLDYPVESAEMADTRTRKLLNVSMNRIRILPTKFAFKDHFILKIQLPK